MSERKSKRILVTDVGSRAGRPNDHFPDGRTVYLDISFSTVKEAVEFLELVRSSKVIVSNYEIGE